MKKEIKKKWVKALRSGKYKQGRGELREEDRFCCLGVLCDLSKLGEWEEYNRMDHSFHYLIEGQPYEEDADGCLPNAGYLPKPVAEWAGMKTVKGQLKNNSRYTHKIGNTLALLNDSGKSFKEIADIIEKDLVL